MKYKLRQLSELAKVMLENSDSMGDHHYQAHQVINQFAVLSYEHKELKDYAKMKAAQVDTLLDKLEGSRK